MLIEYKIHFENGKTAALTSNPSGWREYRTGDGQSRRDAAPRNGASGSNRERYYPLSLAVRTPGSERSWYPFRSPQRRGANQRFCGRVAHKKSGRLCLNATRPIVRSSPAHAASRQLFRSPAECTSDNGRAWRSQIAHTIIGRRDSRSRRVRNPCGTSRATRVRCTGQGGH
jgi:hypothetical protein